MGSHELGHIFSRAQRWSPRYPILAQNWSSFSAFFVSRAPVSGPINIIPPTNSEKVWKKKVFLLESFCERVSRGLNGIMRVNRPVGQDAKRKKIRVPAEVELMHKKCLFLNRPYSSLASWWRLLSSQWEVYCAEYLQKSLCIKYLTV